MTPTVRSGRPSGRPISIAAFTLFELVLAELALLVLALVVPAWLAVRVNQIRIARAERDARMIADAVERFERDLGTLPAWRRAEDWRAAREEARIDLLVGPGDTPKFAPEALAGWASGRVDTLAGQLVDDAPGYGRVADDEARARRWRGPYLPRPPGPDPWQNRYMANVGALVAARSAASTERPALVILSAGPNGIVETPYVLSPRDPRPGGDDVLALVRRARP